MTAESAAATAVVPVKARPPGKDDPVAVGAWENNPAEDCWLPPTEPGKSS